MPLRLGLDFGTATTCLAIVTDLVSFRPEVIPLQGDEPFTSSAVFLDFPSHTPPIVESRSESGRAPLALFGEAESRFNDYWKARVRARADGIVWHDWETKDGRERTMLLSYFKPELADYPVRRPVRVPFVKWGVYDALAQADDFEVVYREREVASPEPDTEDLVAATAAIIRSAVERACRQYSDTVSLLVMGLPSFGNDADGAEELRAKQRRLEAVERSGVRKAFGTRDFRVEFLGEAQAAAFALDLSDEREEVFAVIIDVGAGTTDLALVPFRRGAHMRFDAGQPLMTRTDRFAGRDLNLAVALALQVTREFRDAVRLLDQIDRRAWQLVMDQEMERIKREIGQEEKWLSIRLAGISSHVDGCLEHENRMKTLSRVIHWHLSTRSPSLRIAVDKSCVEWRNRVSRFLSEANEKARHLGGDGLSAIELVGGAFRFEPFRNVLQSAVRIAGLDEVAVRYRDDGLSAQTAVARGLARWAAMQ